MPATNLPVPKLWDSIIDFLYSSPDDLRASALVCRSFTPAAQFHLFREISIEDGEVLQEQWWGRRTIDRSAITGAVLATRLALLLQSSPHLLPYIRALKIRSNHVECYRILAHIPWSRLCGVTLCIQGTASLESIKILMGTASLHTISIWMDADWGGDAFRSIFSSSAAALESLDLWFCGPEPTTTSPRFPAPLSPRPKICHLSLSFSGSIVDILVNAFDFTSLQTLCYIGSWTPTLDGFLRRYGSTVRSISIHETDETLEHLDLGLYFPALKQIKSSLFGFSPMFNTILARLPLNNKIARVELSTCMEDLRTEIVQERAREFEEIALVRMPALRTIEIGVNGETYLDKYIRHAWDRQELVDKIREVFPRLSERNLVSVFVQKYR